ncbi:aspartyl/asparaginyl beta-hydroxylase-like isoform X3 [Spea bombifrons]|uniref:aspartyl/asparaginyl beta-hydroxylase-like isoform X3 n=1 Tax=Spea bombifrons TaxID=233779 RepID=UPI00234BCB60|nr:aspartyl/asparaginyl beta-hydroxylase-like isoform X3 [Spea bombifrons]
MAPKRSSRSGPKRETKHGGKNGKKDGLSGSSFFTWFMVIALLGVWTSVAVVWFDLVDYEEVLGKLGVYDADGDGDFDVEDAKILLGQFTGGIAKTETTTPAEEPGGVTKTKTKAPVKEDLKVKEKVVVQTKEPKTQDTKELLKDIKDRKHGEHEKSKKDTGKEKNDKEEKEQRKKRDERRRRTTSKKTSEPNREKKLDKRASNDPDNED